MKSPLNAQLTVADEHDWIARDGTVWVYLMLRLDFAGRTYRTPTLVREDD